MGFVKGFRLKSLSPRVKPLNLRGSGRRDDLDQRDERDERDQSEVSDIRDQRDERDQRDQSEVSDIRDQRDERDKRDERDGCGHAVDSDFPFVPSVSSVHFVPLSPQPFRVGADVALI